MDCGPPDQCAAVVGAGVLPQPQLGPVHGRRHGRPTHIDLVSSPASNSTAADGPLSTGSRRSRGSTEALRSARPAKLNLSMMGQFPPLPPMGHLDQFLADPGFAARAARLPASTAPRWEWLRRRRPGTSLASPTPAPSAAHEGAGARERQDESSVSDPASASAEMALKAPSDGNAKKRKASGKGKGKDGPGSTAATKVRAQLRCSGGVQWETVQIGGGENGAEENSGKGKAAAQSNSDNGGKKQGKDGASKPPERPRTTSTLLLLNKQIQVRREKISQRMKLLQDLVPGCNKVVGKAVMLDEIINYVQSLQRQVEFLSMKLATVNPQLDFNNLPNLLPKDMHQSCGPLQNSHFPLETSGAPLPYLNQGNPLIGCGLPNGMDNSQSSMHPLDPAFCRPMSSQQHPFLNGVSDAASQVGTFWQDDLQSVVHMDMGQQSQQEMAPTSSNSYNDGSLQTVHMKMEL
ncbi:hypothetical protein Zm00014a_028029 [Zea mays]|uniref:Transcription factor bHLH62 n=1 Tax=Zea mays TaxID=4577 RepID=A0A3L6FHK4_MAIZE|nr:Transcription factor bHLH62 [Zea mays]PWZ32724.1 hypothetical protein Zm00014a_028029 [Zea mays]